MSFWHGWRLHAGRQKMHNPLEISPYSDLGMPSGCHIFRERLRGPWH